MRWLEQQTSTPWECICSVVARGWGWGTWGACEDLCHVEWLGEEALDLTCTCHSHLVLLTQLIHTQNGNDILQILVRLQTS
jgi:hypothetical protein